MPAPKWWGIPGNKRVFKIKNDAEPPRRQETRGERQNSAFFLSASASLRRVLFFGVIVVAALAQTASEKPSVDVRRVGARLACQCGCKDSVATCSMLECSFSKPAKERIAKLQAVGWNDKAIIQQFIADFGPAVYRGDPSAFGWVVPYLLIAPGLALIWWFVRRYRKPRPLPEIGPIDDDPALAKYHEQIEKDLAHLE